MHNINRHHFVRNYCMLTGSIINSKLLPYFIKINVLPTIVLTSSISNIDGLCVIDGIIDNNVDKYIIKYNRYKKSFKSQYMKYY